MQQNSELNKNRDYIDISILFNILWSRKFFIISFTAIFALFSIFYSLSIPNYYQSKALLNVIQEEGSAIDTISSQYGGLVSLAGIDIPQVSSKDKAALVIETIKSREFMKHLITIDGVLEGIMASKRFDKPSQKIIYDEDIYDSKKSEWIREINYPFKKVPSYLEAHEIFVTSMLTIEKDRNSGFISVAVEHISPPFSSYLLKTIIKEVNFLIKEGDLKESAMALNYLNKQAELTLNNNLKDVVNRMYETQLRKQMLSNIRDEYIIIPIDEPFIPQKKTGPNRSIICILITFLGGVLSIIYVLGFYFFSNYSRK